MTLIMEEAPGCGKNDIPCALKSYVKPEHRRRPFGGLPPHACLISFLHWTSKSCRRAANGATAPSFRCPMLWCRESFEDLSAILEHVPVCSCLEDGYYWCAECSRPERFMAKDTADGMSPITGGSHRKDSRLKRASTFFKDFGHATFMAKQKTKSRYSQPRGPSSTLLLHGLSSLVERIRRRHGHEETISTDKEAVSPVATLFKDEDLACNLHRLENLEVEDLQQMLDNFGEAETYLRAEQSICGLEVAPTSDNTSAAPPAFTYPQTTQGLPSFDLDMPELDGTEQFPTAPEHPWDVSRSISPMAEQMDSRPISPTPVSPLAVATVVAGPATSMHLDVQDQAYLTTTLGALSTQPQDGQRDTGSNPISLVEDCLVVPPTNLESPGRIQPECITDQPSVSLLYSPPDHMALPEVQRDSGFHENSTFQTSEDCVREICSLISVVNKEWVDRMTRTPRLLSRCAGLSTSTLFEKGVSAIQQCFRGVLPNTFLEVFGLVHVACAVSYSFNKDDDWRRWADLFSDMMEWQYAIEKDSERQFYVEALEHLKRPKTPQDGWLKQLNPIDSVCESTALMEFGNGLSPTEHPVFVFSQKTELCENTTSYADSLLERLRHGRILQECSTFLDNFEHSGIAERNKALLPGHFAWYTKQKSNNITHLLDHIVLPLQALDGFEALNDIIVDSEFQVKSGLLRTPREVEVALTYGGRFYSRSQQYFDKFHETISSLCDQAMQNFDPSWRNAYYAADLDKVLAVAFEMDVQTPEPEDIPPATSPPPSDSDPIVIQPKRMVRPNPPPRLAIAGRPQQSPARRSPQSSSRSNNSPISASTSSSLSTMPTSASSVAKSVPSTTQFTTPLSTTSFNFTISPVSMSCESFTISPTAVQSASPRSSQSSTNSNPSSNDNGVTFCPMCPAKFTGPFQYRRSNLRRHLRTTSKHSTKEGPRCPEADCGKVFSRSDNLLLHMQRVHWRTDKGEVEDGSSKRRRWTDS